MAGSGMGTGAELKSKAKEASEVGRGFDLCSKIVASKVSGALKI